MRTIFSSAALCVMAVLTFNAGAAIPAKKKAPAKKTGATSSTTKKKPAPAKATASSTARRATKNSPKRPAVTWRNRQMQPTAERYKEIQQALASKGYLQPEEATGAWTPASSEALKKFQTDQNLEGTGKINSLSLMALGLGPKHDTSAMPAPKPPPAQ